MMNIRVSIAIFTGILLGVSSQLISGPGNGNCESWSEWTDCSISCGGSGYRLRAKKRCLIGTYEVEHSACDFKACPVYSSWSSWEVESTCLTNVAKHLDETRRRHCIVSNSLCNGQTEENQQSNCYCYSTAECIVFKYPYQVVVDFSLTLRGIQLKSTGTGVIGDEYWNLDIHLTNLVGLSGTATCLVFKFNLVSGSNDFKMFVTPLTTDGDKSSFLLPETAVFPPTDGTEFKTNLFNLPGMTEVYIEVYGSVIGSEFTLEDITVGDDNC